MFPILFSFKLFSKTITIYSYGLFLLVAIIIGILLFYWLLKQRKIPTRRIFDNILWTILAGLIGARFFYVLFHLKFYLGNWRETYKFWQGGLDFFGAVIAGLTVLIVWLYFKKRKELWSYLDCSVIVMMLSAAIGKVGSFLMGSDLGRPASFFGAVKFPLDNISRHPVQIYEAIIYLFIFLVLFLLFEKTHHTPGFIFFISLILFGMARFFLEFFRAPDIILYKEIWDFTLAHLFSFLVLIVGIIGMRLYGGKHV
ncbi:MAG: prolipoprotein diacylglyceryl transferase family protein [Patescibacteria group bacterium]